MELIRSTNFAYDAMKREEDREKVNVLIKLVDESNSINYIISNESILIPFLGARTSHKDNQNASQNETRLHASLYETISTFSHIISKRACFI